MTWAERLMRLASNDPLPGLVERLQPLRDGFAERARALAAHARLAPTVGAEHSLAAQAARQADLAEAVAEALRKRGATVADTQTSQVPETGSSHWARLVTDLDAARAANGDLLRQIPGLLEDAPDLAPLLHTLRTGLDELQHALRTLIARADPQALN